MNEHVESRTLSNRDGPSSAPFSARLDRSDRHRADRRVALLGYRLQARTDDYRLLRIGRRSAGRPVPAQVQGRDVGDGESHHRRTRPRQGAGHHRDRAPGREAAHRQDRVLDRQARPVRRQPNGPRYADLRILCRHAADDGRGQGAARLCRHGPSADLRIDRAGPPLPPARQPDRHHQPGLAGVLSRHRGRLRAGLGPRRPRHAGQYPYLRACAVRQVRARRYVVLECVGPGGQARTEWHRDQNGIDQGPADRRHRLRPSRRRPEDGHGERAAVHLPPALNARAGEGFGLRPAASHALDLPGLRLRAGTGRRRHLPWPQDRRGDEGRAQIRSDQRAYRGAGGVPHPARANRRHQRRLRPAARHDRGTDGQGRGACDPAGAQPDQRAEDRRPRIRAGCATGDARARMAIS